MINVKNKKTIHNLAKNTFRANRMRNLFAVIAIILTTILFTGLFTIGGSMVTSMEQSTMRQVGGSSHGGFKYLSREEYDALRMHKSIKEISYSVVLSVAENEALRKRQTEIRYANDVLEAEMMFALPTTGRLPQQRDELAVDTLVLDMLGIPAKLGEQVTLEYLLNGELCSDTFTLVGFWEGDILIPASQCWLSREYVEEQLKDYVPMDEGDYVGKINADFNFSNSLLLESKIHRVITESGYSVEEIHYGVNWAYAGGRSTVDAGSVIGIAFVILAVMFCGYLMISNVFLIGVTKDIQYYGLLKTIGTTGRQIRRIIRKQALWLCAIGIPLGALAGCLVGAGLAPVVLSVLSVNVVVVSLNPFIFILSASFAIITVLISISKPSKIAARVSPIEALRRSDGIQRTKKATGKSRGISLWWMAWGNVFRNRKKVVFVIISLSLSLVILNSAYSLANSFDMDKYLQYMISSDFVVADISYFNVYEYYSNQDTLNGEFLEELTAMEGVESLSNIYFYESGALVDARLTDFPEYVEEKLNMNSDWVAQMKAEMEQGTILQHVYGLETTAWEMLTVFEGEIDMEKLATGNYVVVEPYDTEGRVQYYHVGDRVNIVDSNGDSCEYEVLAVAGIPYNISIRHSHPMATEFLLPADIFLTDIVNKAPMLTIFDVTDETVEHFESFLQTYSEQKNPNMDYQSKKSIASEYENAQKTYRLVGIVLSILLAIIGVANFTNTMVTSVISRNQELAVVQSIGMTGRQVKGMLVREGLIYTILTILLSLTVGSMVGYLVVSTISSAFSTIRFTVLPSLICIPLLGGIAVLIPFLSQRMVCKKSIVERHKDN